MELWDLYDESGKSTGYVIERGQQVPSGYYHLAVDIWIVNDFNELLIQKRSKTKRIRPNIWAATGGSVLSGETSLQGCIREAREEIGVNIDKDKARLMTTIKGKETIWDVWVILQDIELNQVCLQPEEVTEVRWASIAEVKRLAETNQFLQSSYLDDLFEYIEK